MRKSRFMQDLSGENGVFWANEAYKALERREAQLRQGKAIIDDNGVIRWASNNHVCPDDVVEQFCLINEDVDRYACEQARDAEITAFVKEYKKTSHKPSAEEMFELRANFPKGTKMVDALSGETFVI